MCFANLNKNKKQKSKIDQLHYAVFFQLQEDVNHLLALGANTGKDDFLENFQYL